MSNRNKTRSLSRCSWSISFVLILSELEHDWRINGKLIKSSSFFLKTLIISFSCGNFFFLPATCQNTCVWMPLVKLMGASKLVGRINVFDGNFSSFETPKIRVILCSVRWQIFHFRYKDVMCVCIERASQGVVYCGETIFKLIETIFGV